MYYIHIKIYAIFDCIKYANNSLQEKDIIYLWARECVVYGCNYLTIDTFSHIQRDGVL